MSRVYTAAKVALLRAPYGHMVMPLTLQELSDATGYPAQSEYLGSLLSTLQQGLSVETTALVRERGASLMRYRIDPIPADY